MKKLLFVCAALLATNLSFGQTEVDSTLNSMTKMELTNIYIEEVTKLAFSTPYTPFTIGVSDSTDRQLDIPASKYLSKKRSSILEMSQQYGSVMKEELYELVPYSDKSEIIKSIMFLREVNENIKKSSK